MIAFNSPADWHSVKAQQAETEVAINKKILESVLRLGLDSATAGVLKLGERKAEPAKIKLNFLNKNTVTSTLSLWLAVLSLSGCSSFKSKTLTTMFVGTSLGAVYGSTRPEFQTQNTQMYAGLGGAIGALAALYIFDPDKEMESIKSENQKLKFELTKEIEPKILYSQPGTFNSKIPEKYQNLISPGEWRISEIDQWIEDSENHLIHQDKTMELVPPALRPLGGVPPSGRHEAEPATKSNKTNNKIEFQNNFTGGNNEK